MATWSISECSIPLREKILRLLNEFNLFLIGYKNNFGNIDNIQYFKEFQNNRSDISWFNRKISHMALAQHYYLFGKNILGDK